MDYKRMIEEAKRSGKGTEAVMWANVDSVSDLLEELREEHPEKYWAFMRRTHEDIYGCHYNEEFARYDIERMHSTDANGLKQMGVHWSKAEVLSALQGKPIHADITDCDKWVAANAMWHDLHKAFDDRQVLNATVLFFLSDEDWQGHGKIWEYMSLK